MSVIFDTRINEYRCKQEVEALEGKKLVKTDAGHHSSELKELLALRDKKSSWTR